VTSQIPALEMPPAIGRAAQTRDERARDLAEAQQALREAQVAIETAIVEDRAAYASARDQGEDDPGPTRECAARERVADAERRLAGEQLRLARAEEELATAVGAHVDQWAARLAATWKKADAASEAALTKFEQAEAKRAEVRRVALWLAGVQETGDLSARQRAVSDETDVPDAKNAGARLRVAQLLDALREHVARSSSRSYEEGAAQRVAMREHDIRLAALQQDERNDVRAAAVEVHAGNLSVDEAELVAAGASLDEIRERAEQRRAAARPAPVGPWG
jgi:hypothetical protein